MTTIANAKLRGRPPGPRGIPLVGSALAFKRDPLAFLTRCAREHGDIVLSRMMGRDVYLLFDPADIEYVLVGEARGSVAKDLLVCDIGRVLGKGLLTSEGDLWRVQRRLLSGAFTPKSVAAHAGAIAEVAVRSIAAWRDADIVNLYAETSRITMNVIVRVLFDADLDAVDARTISEGMAVFSDFFEESPESVLGIPPWVPTPRNVRFERARRTVDAVIHRILANRRADKTERHDLFATLLDARDENGTPMSDHQLRDECVTLFLTGHETTALALAHAMVLLAQHPDSEARWRRELADVLAGRTPEPDDVPRLSHTAAVIKESLRLYPPVWTIGRKVTLPFEVKGHRFARGTQILIPQWVVQRDARWFPDPERFRPERWSDEAERKLPRLAFFPFGAGARICIGNSIAMIELVLLLATLGQRFRFGMLSNDELRFRPSVTLRPEGDVRVRLHAVEP